MMRERFEDAVAALTTRLEAGEAFTVWLSAEESDFVRFNRGRVRHAGSVTQASLQVDLIAGRRHASGVTTLCGERVEDEARIARLVETLREQRRHLSDDPWLLLPADTRSTEDERPGQLPEPIEALECLLGASPGTDLVGSLASGVVHAGFADSRGQRNWHSVGIFHVDWSLFLDGDRAFKADYSGATWNPGELDRRARDAVAELEALRRPAVPLSPGGFRAYLSPAALTEVFGMLGWNGFGVRAHRTRTTPLLRMAEGDARLHPRVTLLESPTSGFAPRFQETGFLAPERLTLVDGGLLGEVLVSPRSAAEYGVPCNGAPAGEMPRSLELLAGDVPVAEARQRLGDGLWIDRLHYLNFSDRPAGRLTGLTRFGTFVVRRGEIEAPAPVMRFDDTVFRMLGENLVALTRERELRLDPSTYGQRSTASFHLPGAILEDFRLTL